MRNSTTATREFNHRKPRKPRKRARRAPLLSVAAGVLLAVPAVHGQPATWLGGAPFFSGTTLWSSPANWTGSAVPVTGASIRIGAGFTSGTNINSAGDRTISGLTVDATAPFTLANFGGSGNTIQIQSGAIARSAASSGTQTISSNLSLGQNTNWNIQGSGGLVLAGSLYTPGFTSVEKSGNGTLTLATGTFDFNGGLAVTAGNVFLNNAAHAVVRSGSNFNSLGVANTSQLSILAGSELATADIARIDDGGSVLVSGAGSKWSNNRANPGQFDPIQFIVVGEYGAASLTVSDGGSLSTRNALSVGDNSGSNGTLSIQSGGKVESQYGLLGVDSAGQGTASLSGAGSSWKINDDLLLGTDNIGRGELTLGRDASVSVNMKTEFTGQTSDISINSGTLSTGGLTSAAGYGRIRLATETTGAPLPTLNLGNGTYSSGAYAGTITGEGNLTKTGTAAQTLNGTVSFQGTTTVNGGELIVPNGFSNSGAGTVIVNSGGALTIGKTALAHVSGLGVINASAALTLGNQNQLDAVNFGGTLNTQGYHVTLKSSNQSVVSGTINLGFNALLATNNKLVNNGVIKSQDNTSATIAGTIENNGLISGATAGFGTLNLTGNVGGDGDYDGQISMSGIFDPAYNGFGTITLNTLFLRDSATFKIGLFADSQTQYNDKIAASRWVDMAGTLAISTTGGDHIGQGDSFEIISFIYSNGTLSGNFSTITGQEINPTTWLAVLYGENNVTLAVTIPGDATLDGKVNISDFSIFASHFNQSGFNWQGGNFNGDTLVDIGDFSLLASRFNQSIATNHPRAAAVPEPVVSALWIGVGLIARRRRARV